MQKYLIITTINSKTEALDKYAAMTDWNLVIVGDRKGPNSIPYENVFFLDIEMQYNLGFSYSKHCPENHYARKNIGYLYALMNGAEIIAETDDDNIPYDSWGKNIIFENKGVNIIKGSRFCNIYKYFTDTFVWPRGYPLNKILAEEQYKIEIIEANIGIWQYLADNEPDVDALYRLSVGRSVAFDKNNNNNYGLHKNVYCPFNSQNTFWSLKFFPLMYLPKSVTFRFTDILRGYIAQRLLWEDNYVLGFGYPTVYQERNYHDLMNDFKDELPMYLNTEIIVEELEKIKLGSHQTENLMTVYKQLYDLNIVDESEIIALEAWLFDVNKIIG